MKRLTSLLMLALTFVIFGCSSTDTGSKYDTSLYQGRPIDTLTQDPPPQSEVEAIQRGDAALNAGNIDLALYEYIRSLSFDNLAYKDQTLYTIGKIHLSRGNNDLAERALNMSINANPNNSKSLEQLGMFYASTGRVSESESFFLRAVNADQLRFSSQHTIQREDVSIGLIESLNTDRTSPGYAYMGLGVLSDVDNEYDIARAFYDKAGSILPFENKVLLNMGYSYYMSGDYTKASTFTQRALNREPDSEKAQNNMALIYLAQGYENRALNMFSRHLERPEALNNVGYFLMLKGKPERAIPYFQQAIDAKPSYYKLANENLDRALSEVRNKEIIITNN
ncbi:tetratricopeptide repeat protein [Vibrio wakamikoensis]|uniref:Tetratricopeptide repeat protein n=1 Tax=Vibrio chaetopteri TaxID=3016528 RepID=A0AAU8BEY1_9VIBR